jgi:hypothetical protein
MTNRFYDTNGMPIGGYNDTYAATSEADLDATIAPPHGWTEPKAPPPTVSELEGRAQWGYEGVNWLELALADARASRERKDYHNEAINLAIARSAT